MKRREFTHSLGLAGMALTGLAGGARAQGAALVEGKDFARLETPAPVGTLPAGKKVEVIEFLWYGCLHCFRLEPLIEAWAKRLPADVHFRQLPFAFIGPVEHQKLFYALEELGQREALQRKVFNTIHVERKPLNSEADITAFVAANGVDAAKFSEAFKSFGVNTKLTRGKALANAYKVDSVPTIGIHGRYFTSASLAGGNERALQVADQLIVRSRQPA
ncbi:MAG TPA: thiol:disulfide interchange protein DsbA/DsbL [Rubrivivax sp.]|nr:thiol:disulfide interchange protein DsbA/DsbL [Rubrivivax sp.]